MKRISILLLVLAIFCVQSASFAREVREYTLEQKVEASDLIFVGNVLAIERPEQEAEGVKAFAVVNVTESIKGTQRGEELKFVVQGAIAESNPTCCSVGSEYLFFARNGVQVLTLEENSIGGRIDLQGEFVSPSNGKFSTYPVVSGVVSSWPSNGLGAEKPLASVREEICEAIRH